jgi:hypothetical protein
LSGKAMLLGWAHLTCVKPERITRTTPIAPGEQ